MEFDVFVLLPLLVTSLVLFTILAIIPLAILRNARHKGLSRLECIIWIVLSVGLFPIGVLLYLLSTRLHKHAALAQSGE